MENNLQSMDPQLLENFEEKRLIGENDTYICSLIRSDSIEEFIRYITQNNYSISSIINPSIFETNPFLIENSGKTSLIEYATFCDSIQIFQYLKINNAKFDVNIYYYAIHGNNPLIIHSIESNDFGVYMIYLDFFIEAIKCHHNNLAEYIKENYIYDKFEKYKDNEGFYANINSSIFEYFNFKFFPHQMKNNDFYFYYGCYYDYVSLVKLLFNSGNYDVNKSIVLN